MVVVSKSLNSPYEKVVNLETYYGTLDSIEKCHTMFRYVICSRLLETISYGSMKNAVTNTYGKENMDVNKIIRNSITPFLFIMLLTSCEKQTFELSDIDQLVLFQTEYLNAAWGYQHSGIFIDTTGNVLGYRNPGKWNFTDSEGYIEMSLLHENLDKATDNRCRVDKKEILKNYNRLYWAQTGKLSEPVNAAYDMGIIRFTGYIYDTKKNKYKEVLLKQYGDIEIENMSPEAKVIFEWLDNICKE